MIAQHHFNNTFSLVMLEQLQSWANTNIINIINNPYLEDATIPDYTGAANQLLINSIADWSQINNPAIVNFYVEPNIDYGTTPFILTQDGSSTVRRTISLYNSTGNDVSIHTGKLADNERAKFKLTFDNASYWTIDRQSWTTTGSDIISFENGASYNIANRMYTDNCGRSVWIRDLCHNNTIQQCRFNSMAQSSRLGDVVCIALYDWQTTNDIYNTKIIANEIRNQNDGIQLVKNDAQTQIIPYDGQGTIIDSNHIYIDSEIFTDGDGNLDTLGIRAEAEDAIDLKYGSHNASNPIIITNNHMWGYRKTDTTNHISGSNGDCIGIHYDVGNITIEDNYFFDSWEGVMSGASGAYQYSAYNLSIKNNVFYECGTLGIYINTAKALAMASANDNIIMENNTIKDCREEVLYLAGTSNSTFRNNTIINQETAGVTGTIGDTIITPNDEYTTAEGVTAGYTEDYVFTTDNLTNSPRQITLTKVVKP